MDLQQPHGINLLQRLNLQSQQIFQIIPAKNLLTGKNLVNRNYPLNELLQNSKNSTLTSTAYQKPSVQDITPIKAKKTLHTPSVEEFLREDLTLNRKIVNQKANSANNLYTKSKLQDLRMEWEDFQNLEEWVTDVTLQPQDIVVDQMLHSAGEEGELINIDAIAQPQNELVVDQSTSNSYDTIPAYSLESSPLLDESNTFNEDLFPLFEALSSGSSSPITNTTMYTENDSNQSILCPKPSPQQQSSLLTNDLLLQNELSNLDDNNLVKGDNNSYSLIDNYQISNNLDVVDINNDNIYWSIEGLKSSEVDIYDPQFGNIQQYEPIVTEVVNDVPIAMPAVSPAAPIVIETMNIPRRPMQQLKINQFDVLPTGKVIDTPEVINTAFDLLAYINDDIEESQASTTTETTEPPAPSPEPISINKVSSTRKRKINNRTENNKSKQQKIDLTNIEHPVSRRGRPPKSCSSSVSSDDVDGSKYRELRDKNNEASRRSRINRKFREAQLEQELVELEDKNIKLVAHVEELEQRAALLKQLVLQNVTKSK